MWLGCRAADTRSCRGSHRISPPLEEGTSASGPASRSVPTAEARLQEKKPTISSLPAQREAGPAAHSPARTPLWPALGRRSRRQLA